MLRRWRLGFRTTVRWSSPGLVALAAMVALGFGAHAALDWHRHGTPGAGFFHLHVHFGHHHHDGHEHHEDQAPEPGSPLDQRRECGTLTLALGVAPAPESAVVETPALEIDERATYGISVLIDRDAAERPWSPRGPPA